MEALFNGGQLAEAVHEIFEKNVKFFPDRVIIEYEELHITYDFLNKKANRLANYLINKLDVKTEDLICLLLDRSELIIFSILGVLKAGCAYVPISPDYPDERIKSILLATKSRVIITTEIHKDRLKIVIDNLEADVRQVCINSEKLEKELLAFSDINPGVKVKAANLAYIITTSGSTGTPKLVMVEHKGIVNLTNVFMQTYNLSVDCDEEVILQMASYTFDGLMEEIILSLLCANKMLIVKNQLWADENRFFEYLNKNMVTHIEVTPSLASLYDFSRISSLKRLEIAGEALTPSCVGNLRLKSSCSLINVYGTTETSMVSTIKFLKQKGDDVTTYIKYTNARIGQLFESCSC